MRWICRTCCCCWGRNFLRGAFSWPKFD